jgi:hypothetical protein
MGTVDAIPARSVTQLLVSTFDDVWSRQRGRLVGLTQEEYLWEPVPDCWTVSSHDGRWHVAARQRPDPVPAPVTTIAWRLWHIASDCLADYTIRGLGPRPFAVSDTEWYGHVDQALAALDQAWAAFRAGIEALGDDGMWSPLGPEWGPYAPEPWAALVVHALDEVAHHGAEIGLLRDLYAHRPAR